MSTERPDDFDDTPMLRPLPPTSGDDGLPDDDRDVRPPMPPGKPGFGFWTGDRLGLLYFAVTQIIAGIGFTILIFGIALFPEIQQNGWDVVTNPIKFKAWMEGPDGRVSTCVSWSRHSSPGLLLSWILLRAWCGKQWKRKIALTRAPTATHMVLVLIGFVGLIALGRGRKCRSIAMSRASRTS